MADQREVIQLPGMPHNAPLPTGAKIGNIVCSSAISGRDPETHDLSQDPDRQAETLFHNVRAFMEKAGGTLDNVVQMTVYLVDPQYNEVFNREWVKAFPDANNRPAREGHIKTDGMYGGRYFEVTLMAVL